MAGLNEKKIVGVSVGVGVGVGSGVDADWSSRQIYTFTEPGGGIYLVSSDGASWPPSTNKSNQLSVI